MAQMDRGYPTEVKTTEIIKIKKEIIKKQHYEYTLFYSKYLALYVSALSI
jgi:hypothetical protein